ncbi:MAG TPA: protein-glutamate O-methyltransferase CheR [Aliiroseovarius sp.]|nr:protein-glutamate O-methyltransferase CheR [Aliiroseovarius sp.]
MEAPTPPQTSAGRKPVLDDRAFEQIAAIAHKEAGLAISPNKAAMVHTRVARRLRALNMSTYDQYCALVASDAGAAERRELVSVLTTNVSHFFREEHHFDRLKEDVLPDLFQKMKAGNRVRIWSAGCSNGQEPYSIAMAILDFAPLPPNADIKILGSDIDPNVISFARSGTYDQSMVSGLPDRQKDTYFNPVSLKHGPAWQAQASLKDLVAFRELNLLHSWPMKGTFDVIFCRNVVIYFDEQTQAALWKKFADILAPGGWLFLGHSERVSEEHLTALPPVGMTTYRRAPIPER